MGSDGNSEAEPGGRSQVSGTGYALEEILGPQSPVSPSLPLSLLSILPSIFSSFLPFFPLYKFKSGNHYSDRRVTHTFIKKIVISLKISET